MLQNGFNYVFTNKKVDKVMKFATKFWGMIGACQKFDTIVKRADIHLQLM